MSQFVDFEIEIDAPTDGRYPVRVRSSAGQARDTLTLPTGDTRYENFKWKLEDPTLGADEEEVIAFGTLLYETLLRGNIKAAFISARDVASRESKNLRIKLSIEPGQVEVAGIPWEFACDDVGRPLATKHSICRFLPRFEPLPALALAAGTRPKLLLGWALPGDVAVKLDVEGEVAAIRQALKPLEDAGQLEIVVIPHLTGPKLQTALEDERPHIFHYVGHGTYANESGALILENNAGARKDLSARQLAIMLDGSSVRLVVLNACKTGLVITNLLSGMAPALMGANVPAVVAMQSSVLDEAGLAFAEGFYRALAAGDPIDGCVARARRRVIASGISNLDWGLATLYMRAPDGLLFSGLGGAADQAAATSAPAKTSPQPTAQETSAKPENAGGGVNINLGEGNSISGSTISFGNVAGGNISQTTNNQSAAQGAAAAAKPDDRAALKAILDAKRARYNVLSLQEAKYGISVPPHIAIERQDLETEIAQLQARIDALGG